MKEVNLNKKKILYIGPASFHYDKYFVRKLIERGAFVYSYDLKNLDPTHLYFKILNKIKIKSKEDQKNIFYNSILLKNDYDYVFVRQGYQLDEEFLPRLRKTNPNAKFINFQWDSIRPQFDYLPIIQYFDKIFSFDIKDCQDYAAINYLPLFYLDIYEDFKNNNSATRPVKKNDLLFIGSWRNTERYNLVKETENLSRKFQLRFYHYLFFSLKNQISSIKNGVIPKEAKSKKLSHEEILNLFSTTNTIIDFPSSFQTGLTIRTFEALAAGKKLITTNKNIINEPFYNPEFINITDMSNLTLNIDFIKNIPKTSMGEMIKSYSIGSYIDKLLQ